MSVRFRLRSLARRFAGPRISPCHGVVCAGTVDRPCCSTCGREFAVHETRPVAVAAPLRPRPSAFADVCSDGYAPVAARGDLVWD